MSLQLCGTTHQVLFFLTTVLPLQNTLLLLQIVLLTVIMTADVVALDPTVKGIMHFTFAK